MSQTISEMIFEVINEIRGNKEKWDGFYLSEKLVELTMLHSSLSSKIAEFQVAYNRLLDMALIEHPDWSAKRAEISAKAGDEFELLIKSIHLEKSLIEEIRSLKTYIKIREREFQN